MKSNVQTTPCTYLEFVLTAVCLDLIVYFAACRLFASQRFFCDFIYNHSCSGYSNRK